MCDTTHPVDDIMKNKCNKSEINEISVIIALLFQLCNLSHYYCYSGVGHHALLLLEHIITLLCALGRYYSADINV